MSSNGHALEPRDLESRSRQQVVLIEATGELALALCAFEPSLLSAHFNFHEDSHLVYR